MEKAPKHKISNEIVRLLSEIQANGLLNKYQNQYLYWDKVKYKKDYDTEKLWSAIKLHRGLNAKLLQFGKYKFQFVITDYIQETLHLFDMHFGGTMGSNIGIADTDKTKYIISSLIEESISSSQMEGANTTRKNAKEMLREEKKPKNKSEEMILNNYITMQHIVQNKDEDLSFERLLEIHKLISNNTLDKPDEEGRFRLEDEDIRVVNYTNSDVVHTPPPQKEIEELLRDLCSFFNNKDEERFIHPIIKASIIHFMIGWIHPFTDGNGRTARALFYWYMLKNGYWLTEYLSISRIIQESKHQYERAYLYTEADDNDLSYFITYKHRTLEKAYISLKEYISRKQKEVNQAGKFLKIPEINERTAQILKLLNDDPDRVLSVKGVEGRFQISKQTAQSDLKKLVDLGFLEQIQANKRKHSFIRSEAFDRILKEQLN